MRKCIISQLGVQSTVGGPIRIELRGNETIEEGAEEGGLWGLLWSHVQRYILALCASFIIEARCGVQRLSPAAHLEGTKLEVSKPDTCYLQLAFPQYIRSLLCLYFPI